MRNKIFTKIIITTLLVAFLTFNVGKVTRVSAVGTTAAIAGTAFLLTGAVYLSYVALTQGEMVLPASEEMHQWLTSIGEKVSQYPSGAAAYQDIYQGLLRDPTANVIDGVWTWTQDRIKDFVNDFSDTRIISDILGYTSTGDVSQMPTNGFTYSITPTATLPYLKVNSTLIPLPGDIVYYSGADIYFLSNGIATIVPSDLTGTLRNYKSGSNYVVQKYANGVWSEVNRVSLGGYIQGTGRIMPTVFNGQYVWYQTDTPYYSWSGAFTYPPLANTQIYDADSGEYLPLEEVDATQFNAPSWVDPDNENRPIIPWVPIPDIPTGVPIPPGYTAPPQWGFPLQDLLDLLEELARGLINIGAIGELINQFAGQHGDNYYLEYNDGDTNYYTYYQPTIFDNDTEYVTYNINVSEQDDTIPVDLNTISLYTQNRYLEQIKDSAIAGSSMLRDLAVFWHDVDPEVTYIVLGCCILVLIGAFTGKLGHS